jgi:hypothetical protein
MFALLCWSTVSLYTQAHYPQPCFCRHVIHQAVVPLIAENIFSRAFGWEPGSSFQTADQEGKINRWPATRIRSGTMTKVPFLVVKSELLTNTYMYIHVCITTMMALA